MAVFPEPFKVFLYWHWIVTSTHAELISTQLNIIKAPWRSLEFFQWQLFTFWYSSLEGNHFGLLGLLAPSSKFRETTKFWQTMINLDSILKSRDITLPTKFCLVKGIYFFHTLKKVYIFVWMWELSHKEGWVPKNSCFWTVVLEKTLESLGLKGDQTTQS